MSTQPDNNPISLISCCYLRCSILQFGWLHWNTFKTMNPLAFLKLLRWSIGETVCAFFEWWTVTHSHIFYSSDRECSRKNRRTKRKLQSEMLEQKKRKEREKREWTTTREFLWNRHWAHCCSLPPRVFSSVLLAKNARIIIKICNLDGIETFSVNLDSCATKNPYHWIKIDDEKR